MLFHSTANPHRNQASDFVEFLTCPSAQSSRHSHGSFGWAACRASSRAILRVPTIVRIRTAAPNPPKASAPKRSSKPWLMSPWMSSEMPKYPMASPMAPKMTTNRLTNAIVVFTSAASYDSEAPPGSTFFTGRVAHRDTSTGDPNRGGRHDASRRFSDTSPVLAGEAARGAPGLTWRSANSYRPANSAIPLVPLKSGAESAPCDSACAAKRWRALC